MTHALAPIAATSHLHQALPHLEAEHIPKATYTCNRAHTYPIHPLHDDTEEHVNLNGAWCAGVTLPSTAELGQQGSGTQAGSIARGGGGLSPVVLAYLGKCICAAFSLLAVSGC